MSLGNDTELPQQHLPFIKCMSCARSCVEHFPYFLVKCIELSCELGSSSPVSRRGNQQRERGLLPISIVIRLQTNADLNSLIAEDSLGPDSTQWKRTVTTICFPLGQASTNLGLTIKLLFAKLAWYYFSYFVTYSISKSVLINCWCERIMTMHFFLFPVPGFQTHNGSHFPNCSFFGRI